MTQTSTLQRWPLELCQCVSSQMRTECHGRRYVRYVFACSFYRAMHYSAKCGLAIACRLSICLSVCPSVCDVGGS